MKIKDLIGLTILDALACDNAKLLLFGFLVDFIEAHHSASTGKK